MLQIVELLCDGMLNPIGVDCETLTLSWKLESTERNVEQRAFQIVVKKAGKTAELPAVCVYDSGKIESRRQQYVLRLQNPTSSEHYSWAVTVWNNLSNQPVQSDTASFESGLLHRSDWQAKWIEPIQRPVLKDSVENPEQASLDGRTPPYDLMTRYLEENLKPIDEDLLNPCPYIRKEFELKKKVRRARAYATARGIYYLEMNGRRVGDLEFMPEITPYDKLLQYQTYDVTELLHEGKNAVGAVLSDGWWAGRIGNYGESCNYGDTLALLLQIEVEHEDGEKEIIASDNSFRSYTGALRYADLFMGEKYDARYERTGWSLPNYYALNWQPVTEKDYGLDALCGQNAPPIRVRETRRPEKIFTAPNGDRLIDFGQVLAGNASFTLQGETGQTVVFQYTEELDENGNFWSGIMGYNHHHTDTYVFGRDGWATYTPHFTYRGFRYVRVVGYDGILDPEKIEARLIASDVKEIGTFSCSDERLTKLFQNIRYSLIGNLMSVPTDNPDRERAGWTGDAQMISPTMNRIFDMRTIWKRWLREFRLEQRPHGGVPQVIPYWKTYKDMEAFGIGYSAGWGDACIILPWEAYQAYGDIRILEENYGMMKGWLQYVMDRAAAKNPPDIGAMTPEREENLRYLWNADYQYGDWLTPSGNFDEGGNYQYVATPLDRFTPCFYTTHSAHLLSKIAEILGKSDDAVYYRELEDRVRQATIAEYYQSGYIMESRFQGATILALKGHLIPEDARGAAVDRLLTLIDEHEGLDTGFSSTQHVFDVLVEAGYPEKAYDLLFSETPPSWLYEIEHGATAIWESWAAISPDGERRPVSFIQYANGCVGDWMHRAICGIHCQDAGYAKIRIAPVLDPKRRIISASGSIQTTYGMVQSQWIIQDGTMKLEVVVPPNTTAQIDLPEVPVGVQVNCTNANVKNGRAQIGSGRYTFEYSLNNKK